MGTYVAGQVVKLMIGKGHCVKGSRVLVLGITFKENCPDIRNTRVIDVIRELDDFGCLVDVYDPWADAEEVRTKYGIDLLPAAAEPDYTQYQAVVLAVAHREFLALPLKAGGGKAGGEQVIYDIKSVLAESDGSL